MSNFLRRYVGTYRVKAHYDLETNDYPKDYDGVVDTSFDDYYISCQRGGEIKHISYTSNLAYYNENITKVYAILKNIIKYELGIEANTRADVEKYMGKLKLVTNIDLMDSEGWFEFKAENIEELAKFLKIHTNGNKISPLSHKNLPKTPYNIPQEDLGTYKEITSRIAGEKINKMRIISDINSGFKQEVIGNDYYAEQRKAGLGFKEFVHSKGLWDKYLEYTENCINA